MIDNQQTSFTSSTICYKEKGKFSSFCKITNTARKASEQIAQMDWLLITRSIKFQICCLLGDFKVGLLLYIWFSQIRENPLKTFSRVGHSLRDTGGLPLMSSSGVWFHNFSKELSSSRLPFLWFIYEPAWLPTFQLFVPTDLLPTLFCPALCPRRLTVIDYKQAPLPYGLQWVQPMGGLENRSGGQGENKPGVFILQVSSFQITVASLHFFYRIHCSY